MAALIPEDTLEKAVALLKAFALPDRFQMVNILMNGERRVGKLAKKLIIIKNGIIN